MTCPLCKGNDHGHRLVAIVHNCERPISTITAPCSCMTLKDHLEYAEKRPKRLGKTGSDSPGFVNEKYRRMADAQARRKEFKLIANEAELLPSEKSAPDLTFVVDNPDEP
jgi:hypothetical protein